jgi:hypothetical protein
MQLCVHSNVGNNNFYEIKTNHKDRYMLMHSCCCNSFILLSGFDPKLKMIQKPFENEVRKSTWKKILFPSSLPFFLFGLLAHFLSPFLSFSFLGRPNPSWQLLLPPISSYLPLTL